jgi:hypothetical protein
LFYLSNDDPSEYETDEEDVAQVFASSNTLGILEYWSLPPRRGAWTLLESPCCSAFSLRSKFLHTQGSLAVNEHFFTLAGLVAAREHILTSLGLQQRQPWPRKLSSPQAREGYYDASKCEDRCPSFFGLGVRLLLCLFAYVSSKEPVSQMVVRITVSLLGAEVL